MTTRWRWIELMPVAALIAAACAAPVEPSEPWTPVAPPSPIAVATTGPSTSSAPVITATPIPLGSLRGTIVYSSDIAGNEDVYRLHVGGDRPARLTDGPEKEFDPALSPDGTRIAYRRNPQADSDAADIWIMNADGTGKRNLTNDPESMNWAPAWTPDGRIAFASRRGSATLELWTMAADGTDDRRISEGWCEYAAPSPDGSMFVCASPDGGAYDLVIVDAATGARRWLTRTPVTEFGPSWSPDGRWIAFGRDNGAHWEIVRVRPDGADEEQVAPEGAFPTWDPDGHLAWSGPGGIDVANADGSGLIALDYPAGFISWGP